MSNLKCERLPPKRRRDSATILATWPDGLQMLFGTSYRTWWDQLQEYCRIHTLQKPSIQVSREPWISFGGLKWCHPDDLQLQLDEEGAGRLASAFMYAPPNSIQKNCLASIFATGNR